MEKNNIYTRVEATDTIIWKNMTRESLSHHQTPRPQCQAIHALALTGTEDGSKCQQIYSDYWFNKRGPFIDPQALHSCANVLQAGVQAA